VLFVVTHTHTHTHRQTDTHTHTHRHTVHHSLCCLPSRNAQAQARQVACRPDSKRRLWVCVWVWVYVSVYFDRRVIDGKIILIFIHTHTHTLTATVHGGDEEGFLLGV
jgi:hypothetical protein